MLKVENICCPQSGKYYLSSKWKIFLVLKVENIFQHQCGLLLARTVQVRAVKMIEKGDEVTQSYLTGKLCTRLSCCSFDSSNISFTKILPLPQGGEAGNVQEQVGLHLRLQPLQPAHGGDRGKRRNSCVHQGFAIEDPEEGVSVSARFPARSSPTACRLLQGS